MEAVHRPEIVCNLSHLRAGRVDGGARGRMARGPRRLGVGLGGRACAAWSFLLVLAWVGLAVGAGEFRWAPAQPTLDRWNYPFNFQAADRVVAPTYGSFDPRFDTRDAELLLGWDTGAAVPTGAGPERYLIRSVRVTLTSVAPIPPTLPFVYDPTYDSYRTYLKAGEPGAVSDEDPGRPIELYGVGFRGGFTVETYLEGSPFGPLAPITSGNISIGTRNAFGMLFDTNGLPIDIANNVGQSNPSWTNAPFEVRPWAVGMTTDVAPGGEMPDGARMAFDLDLADPLVLGYLQQALHQGRLRLMVSSLSPAGQSTPGGTGVGGAGAYPWWANKENLLYDAPKLEIEGVLVGAEDVDQDGLPDDWERFHFGDLEGKAEDDADADGASNLSEFGSGTDPKARAEVLRLAAWGWGEDGRLWVRFPVESSRRYSVETSGDLLGWAAMEGRLTYPEPGVAVWIAEAVSPDAGQAPRFLRVAVRGASAP